MADVMIDYYGHKVADLNGVPLVAAAVGVPTVGAINPTTAAGQSPTITTISGNDRRGSFFLNPVTGGGAQAAGVVAHVTFANPYPAAPAAILINGVNFTNSTVVNLGVTNITAAGFDIVAPALTTAQAYWIQYAVEN